MERLELQAITQEFAKLAQLTEEELSRYASTVASAKAYFERILLRDPVGEEISLSVYACACRAFLNYAILKAATQRTFSSPTGGVYTKISDDETVSAAQRLYREAAAALPAGLVRDSEFVFERTEG